MILKHEMCGHEFQDDEVLLEQRGHDRVQIGINKVREGTTIRHELNFVVLEEGHCDPDHEFTCPGCYEHMTDKELIDQLV